MGLIAKNGLFQCAKLVNVGRVCDERGELCFAENESLPFRVERVFWITRVPEGKTRGGHAHRTCAEIVFPVEGEFDMYVNDGCEERCFHMNRADTGIYIGPNVWCELRNFAPGTVCVVLASHEYLAEGYINDYDEFLANVAMTNKATLQSDFEAQGNATETNNAETSSNAAKAGNAEPIDNEQE